MNNDDKTISMSEAEFEAKIAATVAATVAGLQKAGAIRAPGSGGGSAKGAGHGQVGRPATPGLEAFRIPGGKGVGALNIVSIVQIGTGWSPVGAGAPGNEGRDRQRGKALAPSGWTKAALGNFAAKGQLSGFRFNLAPAPATAPKSVNGVPVLGVLTPRATPEAAALLTPTRSALLTGLGFDPAAWIPAPVENVAAVQAAPVENVTPPVETPAATTAPAAKPPKADKRK